MGWFLGLDSSTQSLSAVVIDTASGSLVGEFSVSFEDDLPEFGCSQGVLPSDDPLVKHSDPLLWLAALDRLLGRVVASGLDVGRIAGISGSGQQHGTVYLNSRSCEPGGWGRAADLVSLVRPMLSRSSAPIWMDSSTSAECAEIAAAAGGNDYVQRTTGSPAIERFSGPQIRRFSKLDPAGYAETAVVHLVSSFMASVFVGGSVGVDHGDGAGMNLLDLRTGAWDPVMTAATAPGLAERLPAVVSADSTVGTIADYFVDAYGFRADTPVIAWSGDNPNSLVGVGGWAPGTVVISLGTSDTLFAAMDAPHVDPAGYGHVFGNPAGGFMSLICFKNGALAREEMRARFGLDWSGFEECLRQTAAGNGGCMMLPYFVPEITPRVLEAAPVYVGDDRFVRGEDAAAAVRAVVEAQAMRLRAHSGWIQSQTATVRVTGGGSANTGICQVLADVFAARVERLETGNSAALGAALRAANAVSGTGWDELSECFCRAVPGMDVLPVQANAAVYRDLLPRYQELASSRG